MLRRTPLRRKARLRPRSKRNSYARRQRDPEYMAFVRRLPCSVSWPHGCQGPVEAHHAGERPFGRKAPDWTCLPLCHKAHHDWHSGGSTWKGVDRRAWASEQIGLHRLAYAAWVVQERAA